MRLIEGNKGLPCLALGPEQIRAATSPTAMKIIGLLAGQDMHATAIAKALGLNEQRIYYHVHNLRKAGVLTLDRVRETGGATAKMLSLKAPAFATHVTPLVPVTGGRTMDSAQRRFLEPFIMDGTLNARIVIGSPDPHGPEFARGRDAGYAIDLGMFLGMFLDTAFAKAMILDTELTEWDQNLIIVGGPVVNKAADRVNARSPVQYREKQFRSAGNAYTDDATGIIVKMPNPRAPGKWVLLVSGKRYTGTQAAIMGFLRHFDELCARVKEDGTCTAVLQGYDKDSDGAIDTVAFLE